MEKIQLDHFAKAQFLSCLKVSPDAKRAAWITWQCKDEGYKGNIWMKEDQKIIQLTQGWETDFIWDDESTLLFVSKNHFSTTLAKQEEVTSFYRIQVEGGESRGAFSLPCIVNQFYKLEKGVYLILAQIHKDYPDYATYKASQRKEIDEKRKLDEDYQVVEESPFVKDGAEFIDGLRDALFIYDENKDCLKRITEAHFSVDSVAVHPTESKFVFSGGTTTVLRQDQAGIFVADWKKDKVECLLEEGVMRVSQVGWQQNQIFFCGSTREKYGISENNWFYQLNPCTKQMICLLETQENLEGSTLAQDCIYGDDQQMKVSEDAVRFICTVAYQDELGSFDQSGLRFNKPICGAIQCFDQVDQDTTLLIGLHKQLLQELYRYDHKHNKTEQLTHFNDEVLQHCYVAKPQPLFFESHQKEVHGWILYPKDFDDKKLYPGILDIHGGPKGAYSTTFFHEMQLWASEGYFVFFCNPFGSDGRGNDFADLRGKYGTVDYEDIMAFTDHVLAHVSQLDKKRLGVTGGSYGGYMTNWIIGHTTRFAAAASQRSIANWVSMITTDESGFSFDTDQMATTPWIDVNKIWDQSPLPFAPKVITPTLFIHSFLDYSCPVQESWQMYNALVQHHVKARLCLFKKESHGLSRVGKRHHRIRRLKEITEWMNQFLQS